MTSDAESGENIVTARKKGHHDEVTRLWLRPAMCAAGLLFTAGLITPAPPTAEASVCGSIGGRFVDVTGCSDPFYELNDALQPPPPPGYVPPPPPPPNVTVCANVGRRISVSGCF